ncbi:MAG: class I SAM-dependent methyltransferase [Acidobacteria bacterium]|nr:MAG: class I SAM-dependent methyltransferase [Acidobacteriota bacterium]
MDLNIRNESAGPAELQKEYERRFSSMESYRNAVWSRLVPGFFQALVPEQSEILDLGCGYGEFINHIKARTKYAMDLNPDTGARLNADIKFFLHDCSIEWPLGPGSLDLIFSSNFFEHLPSKRALSGVIENGVRCLKPGGRLICLGPNVKYLGGAYWDFWDHHIPLSERSLQELLELKGLQIAKMWKRFLPYTMSNGFQPSPIFLDLYLKLPWIWPLVGRQFLIIAEKPV